MNQPLFTGVCTALVTPFLDNKINYPMMQQLLRRQMDAGIEAVVVAGTTGEASTLSHREIISLIEASKSYVGNRCKIIAGTGSNDTAHAVALTKAAEAAGADGALVVTPYYNKATPTGLYAHYAEIAQAVDIPIILYNVPSRTGVDIPVSVYENLARIPNIIGVKEANQDITKVAKILSVCKDFSLWTGNDEQIVPTMSLGGKGVISVLSNVLPEETSAMTHAALAGAFDTAASLQLALQPLIELLFCEVNPIPVKAAMKYIGYDCGGCRLPLTPLKKEYDEKLRAYFA